MVACAMFAEWQWRSEGHSHSANINSGREPGAAP